MFTGPVVTDYPMRRLPSERPRVGGAEFVSVLAWRFPVEVHGLAFEYLAVSAGHFDDFAEAGIRDAVVPEMAEMHPTATWSVGGIDDSPPLLTMPIPHRPY
jgi:hypothetical protein